MPKPLTLSRRHALGMATTLALLPGAGAMRADTPRRIVSLDYGLASTLISLGIVPQAVASLADWDIWVIEPAMPTGVIDLGNSWEVNLEILASLKPDLILTTPYLDSLKPRLEEMGPVRRLEIYSPEGGDILPKAIAATRMLGGIVGRADEAERFLGDAERFFDDCRSRIERLAPPPVALVSFLDSRHIRIYGAPGLYHNVLTRLGIVNAWSRQSNYWGFDTIGIEELSTVKDPRTILVAFEPVPADVLPKLADSPLWNALPFANPRQFAVIPGSLMFGMVNDAKRFARLLTAHLESLA